MVTDLLGARVRATLRKEFQGLTIDGVKPHTPIAGFVHAVHADGAGFSLLVANTDEHGDDEGALRTVTSYIYSITITSHSGVVR